MAAFQPDLRTGLCSMELLGKLNVSFFQDGMRDPRQVVNLLAIIDIVPDTHVKEGARSFRWSRFPKEEQIGKDLQKWIPKELWKVVNECFGGLC